MIRFPALIKYFITLKNVILLATKTDYIIDSLKNSSHSLIGLFKTPIFYFCPTKSLSQYLLILSFRINSKFNHNDKLFMDLTCFK